MKCRHGLLYAAVSVWRNAFPHTRHSKPPRVTSPHLTSPHITSLHPASPHLTSPSNTPQACALFALTIIGKTFRAFLSHPTIACGSNHPMSAAHCNVSGHFRRAEAGAGSVSARLCRSNRIASHLQRAPFCPACRCTVSYRDSILLCDVGNVPRPSATWERTAEGLKPDRW